MTIRKLPTITVVTGTEVTKTSLTNQLNNLMGDMFNINGVALDEGVQEEIVSDLIVVSSSILTLEEQYRQHVPAGLPRIIARRIIDVTNLDELLLLPAGTEALLVNDVERSAIESIISLQQLGLAHISFVPYSPKNNHVPAVDLAITPGEIQFVPASIERVIDIGPRLIDVTTVIDILRHFGIADALNMNLSEIYMKNMMIMHQVAVKQLHEYRNENYSLRQLLKDNNIEYNLEQVPSSLPQLASSWTETEKETYKNILEIVAEYNDQGEVIGRKLLAELSQSQMEHLLSEQQVRQILDKLEERGLIIKRRGRYGTRITPLGENMLNIL